MINFKDKYFKDLPFMNFIEVCWNRKTKDYGDFSVYMAASDYDPRIKYVTNDGRPETGIIQKILNEETDNGDFVTLKGFFIDKIADYGVLSQNFVYKDTQSGRDVISILLSKGLNTIDSVYPPNVSDYTLGGIYPEGLEGNIEKGKTVGKALMDILPSDMFFYCKPLITNSDEGRPLLGLDFQICKGRNLTNNVYFGKAYNNVSKLSYDYDESNAKNRVICQLQLPEGSKSSEWKGFNKIFTEKKDGKNVLIAQTEYLMSSNTPKQMGTVYPHMLLQCNIEGDDIKPTNSKSIIRQMKQQGKLELLNHYKVEKINADVLQERFFYLTDYDLGDSVTVVINNEEWTVPIMEIHETHHNNMVDINIDFGTGRRK